MRSLISTCHHGFLRLYNAIADMVGMAHYSRGIVLVRPRQAGRIGGGPTKGHSDDGVRVNGNVNGMANGTRRRGGVASGEEKNADAGESVTKWIEDRCPSLAGTFKPSWWLSRWV